MFYVWDSLSTLTSKIALYDTSVASCIGFCDVKIQWITVFSRINASDIDMHRCY